MAPKRGRGRPKLTFDIAELMMGCEADWTQADIAGWFRCSKKTIEKYAADKNTKYDYMGQQLTFRELMEFGRDRGVASLRAAQHKAALAGNPTMLIWMGKQRLGQRDYQSIEMSNPDGSMATLPPVINVSFVTAQPAPLNGAVNGHTNGHVKMLDSRA